MNTNNLHRLIALLESLPEEQTNPNCACDISACLVGWLPVLTGVMTNRLHEFLDVHPEWYNMSLAATCGMMKLDCITRLLLLTDLRNY